MSPSVKKALKFLLFLGIGVGLVYLSVKDISAAQWEKIKNSHPDWWWVLAAMVAIVLSHWLRAVRWRMLIEPFAEKPSRKNAFFAVIIGYMANYAPLPRLGEVYRCVILNRYEKTPFTELVGTIIVERALDFLMMILFFALMLLLRAGKVYGMVMNKGQAYLHTKMEWFYSHIVVIIVIVVVVVAAILYVLLKNKTLFDKIKGFVNGFWEGIRAVGKLRKPVLFWFYTVAIWICYLFGAYLCFLSLPQTSGLTLADGLVILIFGAVGVIVTPGGIGAYQVLVGKSLQYIYGLSAALATAMAWIIWGSQFILVITLGLISLMLLPILNKNDKT